MKILRIIIVAVLAFIFVFTVQPYVIAQDNVAETTQEPQTPACAKDGRLDCSSLSVSVICEATTAVFTIMNTGEPGNGDMVAPTMWRLFVDGVQQDQGEIQIAGGATMVMRYEDGGSVLLQADQQVGHPGNSRPNASTWCGSRDQTQNDSPPTVQPQPLTVCWLGDQSNSSSWEVENPNPTPLLSVPDTKVLWDWELRDASGAVLQSATRLDNPGAVRVNTVKGDQIILDWYLVVGGVVQEELGSANAYAVAEDACDGVITQTPPPTETETETPTATDTPTPTSEVTEDPTSEVTEDPTSEVTEDPTSEVTEDPTSEVTEDPTSEVTEDPTSQTATPTQAVCDVTVAASDTQGLIDALAAVNGDPEITQVCLTNSRYEFTAPFGTTQNALPQVTQNLDLIGNGATIARLGSQNMRLMELNGVTDAQISDLTFEGGNITGDGGGMLVNFSTLVLDNVSFLNNSAANGGGLQNLNSNLNINGGTFDGNDASSLGGGYNGRGFLANGLFNNTTFTGNSGSFGGAVANESGQTSVNTSVITGNTANTAAGLYNRQGTVIVYNTIVANNSAIAEAAHYGGALATETSTTTINYSCITDNQSATRGDVDSSAPSASPMDARFNWWGAVDGPSPAPGDPNAIATGSGDSVRGAITFEPFYIEPLVICGGTSNPPPTNLD